jgi:SAM-dependent methyltransferase
MPSSQHWQQVYEEHAPDEVSWFEPIPERSLRLIDASGLPRDASILDVGGGASALANGLLSVGYRDITVADLSAAALEQARQALGRQAADVDWVIADVREHDFGRQFDLWHDRALFHFMVERSDREAYLSAVRRTLRPGGYLIIAGFGPDGPARCSGLPVSRYSPDDLSAELGGEFNRLSDELVAHRTPSGNQQQFLYAHFRRKERLMRSRPPEAAGRIRAKPEPRR